LANALARITAECFRSLQRLLSNLQKDSRDTWIGQLTEVQAQAKNVKMAQLWKQLKQWEKSMKLAGQVKRALGKESAQGGLTQVEALATQDGKTCECIFSKDKLEWACLEEA